MAITSSKLIPSSSSSHFFFFNPNSNLLLPKTGCFLVPVLRRCNVVRARKTKRTGNLRYPSEKKRLKLQQKDLIHVRDKFKGVWRLSKLGIPVERDPGKDFLGISEALLEEIAKVLKFPVASLLPEEAFTIVRKSFDARKKEPKFVYTVNIDVNKLISMEPRTYDFISELEPRVGVVEHIMDDNDSGNVIKIIANCRKTDDNSLSVEEGSHDTHVGGSLGCPITTKPKVAVVGSGPSGLFSALVLAEFGADVTLLERGEPVERRGRDIGALVVRRLLQQESNFCFGEGGAGTWSDGKLVTRIGKNSSIVVAVLKTLIHFGAPEGILVSGKPHLGTDRLVPLLRNFRLYLQDLGVTFKFRTRLDDLLVEGSRVVGIRICDTGNNLELTSQKMGYDAVVLAVGHSARDTYKMLLSHNVELVQKDFSVGLRIEHPQALMNSIQYSELAHQVQAGRGKVPVADYKVAGYVNQESDNRSCYSFCMCPGGQVVLTSTDPSELCINGMSFSRRSSKWANAALVVSVSSKDFNSLNYYGPLAGVEFQRSLERKAAMLGGGNFVVPVQTVTDFLDNKLSVTSVPASSYRLGVKAANLHELFPSYLAEALQNSILMFEDQLPGFVSENALLHGVETRTSSPVKISRDDDTYESTTLKGLYPIGEGAGYAGGIMSAAVDGVYAGFALAKQLGLFHGSIESVLGKDQKNPGFLKY